MCVCVTLEDTLCLSESLVSFSQQPEELRGWLLFDLVCFGLLIKHGLYFVGGASQSGALQLTHPRLYSSPPQVCRLHRKLLQSQQNLRQGLTPNLEAQSQGDFKIAGRN